MNIPPKDDNLDQRLNFKRVMLILANREPFYLIRLHRSSAKHSDSLVPYKTYQQILEHGDSRIQPPD